MVRSYEFYMRGLTAVIYSYEKVDISEMGGEN